MQPQIHLIDQTWINVAVQTVSSVVADPVNWPNWWPGLSVTVSRNRGAKGIQWEATGAFVGSIEIWLEPVKTGVILHHFLRLDPADGRRLTRRQAARQTRAFAWHAKQVFWELKDRLESAD